MPVKNILWISRHQLWTIQEALLRSAHGKKCAIEQISLRFRNFDHFLDVLVQNQDEFYIYAVIPEQWKRKAVELGYPLGTVNRPHSIKDQGKRKRIFTIEYIAGQVVTKRRKGKAYNTKGYAR